MVKVSISLPNNTQITFESEEAEVLHEVVGMVLRDLPRDLMQSSSGSNGLEQNGSAQKSSSVATTAVMAAMPASGQPSATGGPAEAAASSPRARRTGTGNRRRQTAPPTPDLQPDAPPSLVVEDHPEQARLDFAAFCQSSNPMGDMRRVVVATEGAARYFGVDGVTSGDLERLFDLAGWRRPGNFTQTLRNTARAKFGWLERIPGRSGRYAATDLGRSVTHTS